MSWYAASCRASTWKCRRKRLTGYDLESGGGGVVATLPALLLAHIAPLSAPKRKRPVTGLFSLVLPEQLNKQRAGD